MYLVIFYFLIFLVLLVIVDIVYVSIIFSKNKIGAVWPMRILRSIVSYIVTILFMPIVEFFMAVLECSNVDENGEVIDYYMNNNIQDLRCWEGPHIIHATLAILSSVIFCSICIVVQKIFYETKTDVNSNDAKTNSKADLFTLYVKICCIFLYSFIIYYKNLHWIVVIGTFILSLFQFYIYYTEKPFYDEKTMTAYLIYTGIFLWNNTVLLLGKILENSEFDGCIELFIVGIPIVVWIILTQRDTRYSLLLTPLSKLEKGDQVEKQVRYFLELVDKRDSDRESKLMLRGYIHYHVEICNLIECPLKKYLNELNPSTNQDAVAFLYEHAQSMFQLAISKFAYCTSLRMSYAFFLQERLSNKRQSLLELKNAEKYGPTFEEQFIIYRFNKLIEEQSNEKEEGELDVVSNIAYRNHFIQFKQGISKATELYTEFWKILQNSTQDTQEDLEKMNDYGSKINETVEEINSNFDKMQKLKSNDVEVYQMYSEFLTDILNEKEKAIYYKNRINEMEDSQQEFDVLQNANIDFNNNNPTSDEVQFMILSAELNNIGLITKISTGICSLIGYTRDELVGKNIEFIMPEQYHKAHKKILKEKLNDYKKCIASNLHNKNNANAYKPTQKEIFVFGKNKSRYLVPLTMKVSLMPANDGAEVYFTARVFTNDLISYNTQPINMIIPKICYVITNNKFIVQNFTPNSMSVLGLNPNSTGNMDITKWIKDFSEDFYQIELEEKTIEQVIFAKRQIVNSKYKAPSKVIWRTTVLNAAAGLGKAQIGGSGNDKSYKTRKSTFNNGVINKTPIMRNVYKEEPFLLSTTDIFLLGISEGFIFRFESIQKSQNSNNISMFPDDSSKQNFNFAHQEDKNSKKRNNNRGKEEQTPSPTNELPKIDKDFTPNHPLEFHLDSKNMTFVSNPSNSENLKEFTKMEAEKIFNKVKMGQTQQITENEFDDKSLSENSRTSNSDSSYTESSFESSSINSSRDGMTPELKDNPQNEIKVLTKAVTSRRREEDYYHVDVSSVTFLIFNYEKEKIIKMPNNDRQSQVEFKKTEDYRKEEKLQYHKKEMERKKEYVKDEDFGMIEESSNITNNEIILMKEIGYALSKVEVQPEVIRMKWISFLTFVILIVITSILLALFVNNQSDFLGILNLMVNSNKLISNSIIGLFYTREFVLTNHPRYNNYLKVDKTESIKNITQNLLNLFTDSFEVMSTMTESQIMMENLNGNSYNTKELFDQRIFVELLEDRMTVKFIELSLNAALQEANTALYHISNEGMEKIYPTNQNIFFYVRNSFNSLLIALQNCAKIYVDEVQQKVTNRSGQFSYILITISIACFVFFFALKMSITSVINRKASYLEVFFEIESDVIKKSIEKCEKFAKKLTAEDQSDGQSTMLEFEDDDDDKNKTEDEIIINKNNSSSHSKKKGKSNSETKIITFKIVFGLFFVFLYFLLVTIFYSSYLETLNGHCNFYNITAAEQGYYLLAFNILREYYFDHDVPVYNTHIEDVLSDYLSKNYDDKSKRDQLLEKYYDNLPTQFKIDYETIRNSDICYIAGNLFEINLANKGFTCENFINNSTSFGLDILITNYIEEIRASKNNHDLVVKRNNFNYNNTIFNPNLNSSENKKYLENNFQIFNTQSVRNLGYLSIYIIAPAFQKILSDLNTNIISFINSFGTIYLAAFGFFFCIQCGVYLFIWRPFENLLNQTVN